MSETEPLLGSRTPPPFYSPVAEDVNEWVQTVQRHDVRKQRNEDKPPSPLLPRNVISKAILVVAMFMMVAVTVFCVVFVFSRPRDILDPIERENIRREWRLERANHDNEHKQWELERKDYDEFKLLWGNEKMQYEKELQMRERERAEWEAEKARHNAEDRRWEQERWERMQLYWGNLWRNNHCHAYATREYTARLWNIAPGADGVVACQRTSTMINGRTIMPSSCEDRGRDGIHGHWLVDFGETACQPYWDTLSDKGCVPGGSGLHRVEARLENIQSGDNWQAMCDTTPNVVSGIKFNRPTSCENRGFWYGMVGIWEYRDAGCY
ncbi:hypothetical protein BC835DRAFT_1326024 [Cytidiella melzeri]|nr:hypothetical protein BC835DRAFT_1326024 [Cytidiella melzeri]